MISTQRVENKAGNNFLVLNGLGKAGNIKPV